MISNVTEIRDYEQACYGNIIFSYLIPSILHLTAYLYTVYLFRIKENEQLQNLMERAFLLSSNLVNRGNQKRLVKILWLFIGLGIVWMIATSITVNLMMAQETILFQWLEQRYSTQYIFCAKIEFHIICNFDHTDIKHGNIFCHRSF